MSGIRGQRKPVKFPFPKAMMREPHGNLAAGVPLKPYDGITSWFVVRVQIAAVCGWMANPQ